MENLLSLGKNKFSLLFLGLLISSCSVVKKNGPTDSAVNLTAKSYLYIKELKQNGIDTLGYYKRSFPGKPIYVFWIDNGKAFARRVPSEKYFTAIVPIDNVFDYYFENKDTLKREQLNGPEFLHYRHQELFILVNNDTLHKEVPQYENENKKIGTWINIIERTLFDGYM